MRTFIACLGTETNTFSPMPTGLATFEETMLYRGDATRRTPNLFSAPLHAWREMAEADGAEVTTIEGLAAGGELHPMQAAFREHHGLQCGFCTPGMVMSAIDLARRVPDPTEEQVREWLEGNICRCTGYHNIVKAIRDGAKGVSR